MKGFSPRNVQYMTLLPCLARVLNCATACCAIALGPHHRAARQDSTTKKDRDWYAAAAVEYGWSRNVLMNMIMNKTLERTGAAPSELRATACCATF